MSFLTQNIKQTDLADQEHYICHCKKTVHFNCHELASHLQFMNKIMTLFLGANDAPPFTYPDLKNICFKMMPSKMMPAKWNHAFINNREDIASDNI